MSVQQEVGGRTRVAFVSTCVSPYSISARQLIDRDERVVTRHIYARKLEPGRQWLVPELPQTFRVASGFTLRLGRRFWYVPLGLPGTLREFKPDVIVSEQLGSLLLFTLMYAIPARVPVLLRWEGTPHTERRFSGLFRRMFRRFLASRVHGFLCYSSGAECYLKSLGQMQPTRRIPYSVDDATFHPPARMEERYPNVFLFVGQIIERKGLHLLLPAFCDVVRLHPQAELWIVGDGHMRAELQAGLPEPCRDNIKWLGFMSHTEIADQMRKAGVLVCPTLEDHGPVVQIEAAKTGLPIISTPYSGNAELVIELGVNGYIIDPADRRRLVEAMIALLECPDRMQMYAKSLELAGRQGAEHESVVTIDAVLELTQSATVARVRMGRGA